MSRFSFVENTPAHICEVSGDTVSASATSQTRIKIWQIEILVVLVGLVALTFFIALGGVFALLGPWMIYMGVVSIRMNPGSARRILCIITGAGLLCLSAAVLLARGPGRPWCFTGGILCLFSGAGYLAAALFMMRKTGHHLP